MTLDKYCNSSASDRFKGEALEPPLWDYCENCGGRIFEGEEYYEHDSMRICDRCARRYAWGVFLLQAKRRTAE
jgi:hypothetical protein